MDEIIKKYRTEIFDEHHYICSKEEVIYQRNMAISIAYAREYYEKYLSYENTEISKKLNRFRVSITEKYSKNSILDIGVGSGEFIKKSSRRVFGYDINNFAIDWLKANNIFLDPYTYIPNEIDCITFFDSIEHIINPTKLLKRIISGTYVIISIPIFENLIELKSNKHFRPNEHFYYFSKKGFISFMRDNSFAFVLVTDEESKSGRQDICTFVFQKTPFFNKNINNQIFLNKYDISTEENIYLLTQFVESEYLFFWGRMTDLSTQAQQGLLSHLYGWCHIQNQEEKGEKYLLDWYEKDALADKLAIDWGYEQEIQALRAIRPLKVSGFSASQTPIYLSEYSVPNQEFYDNLILFFNQQDQETQNKINNEYYLFYKDRFSVALKTSIVPQGKKLIIFTQSNNFETEFQKLLNQNL